MRGEGKKGREIYQAKARLRWELKKEADTKIRQVEIMKGKRWHHRQGPPDVIVIPVCWRRHSSADDINEVAQTIEEFLGKQGVDVKIDNGDAYTPGQKFSWWEQKG